MRVAAFIWERDVGCPLAEGEGFPRGDKIREGAHRRSPIWITQSSKGASHWPLPLSKPNWTWLTSLRNSLQRTDHD